jgi:hypothetical protein
MSEDAFTAPPAMEQHRVGAPAGWYQDPEAPVDAGRRRWWDGTAWGDHMVWSGAAWIDVDAPTQRRARRVWLWVGLGVLVLALGGCGVVVLLGIGMDAALTHDLVDADFTETAEPFHTGSDSEVGAYTFELVDDAYRIRATGPNESIGTTVGEYARTAYTIDTTVEVVDVSSPDLTVAVGCVDREGLGYLFTLGPDGAAIQRAQPGELVTLGTMEEVALPAAPFTLALGCHQAMPNPNDTAVTASVDGERLLAVTDDQVSGFDAVLLGLRPDTDDASVTFDDVVATVPGG